MRIKASRPRPDVPFYAGSPLARYEVQFTSEEAYCLVPDLTLQGMFLPGFEFRVRGSYLEINAARYITKHAQSAVAVPATRPTPWRYTFDTATAKAIEFEYFQTACLDLLKNRFYRYRELDERPADLPVTDYVDEIAAVVECLSKLLYPLVAARTKNRFHRGFLNLYTGFLRSLEEYSTLRGAPVSNTRLFRKSLLRFFVPGQLAKIAHQYYKCLPAAENSQLVVSLTQATPSLLKYYTHLTPGHPDYWINRLWRQEGYYRLEPTERQAIAARFAATLQKPSLDPLLALHPHPTLCALIGLYRQRLRA